LRQSPYLLAPLFCVEKSRRPSALEATNGTKETSNKRGGHPRASNAQAVSEEKFERAMLLAAAVLILAWPSTSVIAQHVAAKQESTVPASAAAPSIIITEGELKATVFTYRDDNLIQSINTSGGGTPAT